MLGFGYYFIMVSWLKGHGLKITIQSDLKSVNLPRFHPQLDERTLLTMLTKTMSSSGHWSCFVLFFYLFCFYSCIHFAVWWCCCDLLVALYFLMMLSVFGMQLWLTFTLFLLKTGWRLWFGGKCFLIRLTEVLATLVWTFALYGGLNQMMSLFLFLFVGAIVFFLAVVKAFVEST